MITQILGTDANPIEATATSNQISDIDQGEEPVDGGTTPPPTGGTADGGTTVDTSTGGLLDGNLLNVNVNVDLDTDLAAPIAGAVAANANVAAPISASVAANIGSVDSRGHRGFRAGRDHRTEHRWFGHCERPTRTPRSRRVRSPPTAARRGGTATSGAAARIPVGRAAAPLAVTAAVVPPADADHRLNATTGSTRVTTIDARAGTSRPAASRRCRVHRGDGGIRLPNPAFPRPPRRRADRPADPTAVRDPARDRRPPYPGGGGRRRLRVNGPRRQRGQRSTACRPEAAATRPFGLRRTVASLR